MAILDFRNWDWLPGAAEEVERYLVRLLTEAAVKAHDVSARPKSITSFQSKCERKNYPHPLQDVTDTVAVRIITYSVTDRERAEQLIRGRFEVREDHNPGDSKPPGRRGYDCQHLVVTGENPSADRGWLIAGGNLVKYFNTFGGLEIQIRTVAAHAWAEFEHSRRYKGQPYAAISDQDRKTIDQLFGAASDARRALDETFVAIDMVLANPTASSTPPTRSDDGLLDDAEDTDLPAATGYEGPSTPVQPATLLAYLNDRFPDDQVPSTEGLSFGCQLVSACSLDSVEALSDALDTIDGDQVRRLMDTTTPVTSVRRLDDELLAKYCEIFNDNTGALGNVEKRGQQLEWRYDRVRNKVSPVKYAAYSLDGADCPERLRGALLPAARMVRELARLVAERNGPETAHVPDAVSATASDLLASARAKEVELIGGGSLWVTTNLRRESSEALMQRLLHNAEDLDLKVMLHGREVASTA